MPETVMLTESVQLSLIALASTIATALIGVVTLFVTLRNKKTGQETHMLVNSQYGAQLNAAAAFARRLANVTKNEADIAAADLADKAVAEHNAKQAVVDAK